MWCTHIKLQHNAEAVRGHGHQTGGHHQANIHTHILNSIFEGFVSEQENSEIDGLNRTFEGPASEQENFEIDGLNSNHEGPTSEQENFEIDRLNSIYKGSKTFNRLRAIIICSIKYIMTYSFNWKYRTIFVQRVNILRIHRSFPCPTKGLFTYAQYARSRIEEEKNMSFFLHKQPNAVS